jgi:hypothetical protein
MNSSDHLARQSVNMSGDVAIGIPFLAADTGRMKTIGIHEMDALSGFTAMQVHHNGSECMGCAPGVGSA